MLAVANAATGDELLRLLKAEPDLMPPAPDDAAAAAIEQRRLSVQRRCLRCGAEARCAYVAHTKRGNRWLDLCPGCEHWLRSTAT